jgi:hypothetical protein
MACVNVDVVLLSCEAVWTCGYIPAFRRNLLPPSSGPKSALKMEMVCFFRNVVIYPQVHTASQPRKTTSISSPLKIIIIIITIIRIMMFI